MNDDDPSEYLATLRGEHRRLDEEIRRLLEVGETDQLEMARLKKRKLALKDEIALVRDNLIPDIIA